MPMAISFVIAVGSLHQQVVYFIVITCLKLAVMYVNITGYFHYRGPKRHDKMFGTSGVVYSIVVLGLIKV